jgi:hypothetical protein
LYINLPQRMLYSPDGGYLQAADLIGPGNPDWPWSYEVLTGFEVVARDVTLSRK